MCDMYLYYYVVCVSLSQAQLRADKAVLQSRIQELIQELEKVIYPRNLCINAQSEDHKRWKILPVCAIGENCSSPYGPPK